MNLDYYSMIKSTASICGAAVLGFMEPVMPYAWLCTAMVAADVISSRMLARRIRKSATTKTAEATKFSSHRFGAALLTLAKVMVLLLLSRAVDIVLLNPDSSWTMLRFSTGLVCFWQLWSILENESSANDAAWARLAQRILIDKTERHLGIDLKELKNRQKVKNND